MEFLDEALALEKKEFGLSAKEALNDENWPEYTLNDFDVRLAGSDAERISILEAGVGCPVDVTGVLEEVEEEYLSRGKQVRLLVGITLADNLVPLTKSERRTINPRKYSSKESYSFLMGLGLQQTSGQQEPRAGSIYKLHRKNTQLSTYANWKLYNFGG